MSSSRRVNEAHYKDVLCRNTVFPQHILPLTPDNPAELYYKTLYASDVIVISKNIYNSIEFRAV